MDYRDMKRIPVDPRVIDRIQQYPRMEAEQGVRFMQGWGGPNVYKELAKFPVEERVCYAAILDGHVDEDQLGIITGLSPQEISKGLLGLERKGVIQPAKELEPLELF